MSYATDAGKNDLATKLRAAIAQKQLESDTGKTSGGDLLRLMKFFRKEDVIDMDGLVYIMYLLNIGVGLLFIPDSLAR